MNEIIAPDNQVIAPQINNLVHVYIIEMKTHMSFCSFKIKKPSLQTFGLRQTDS